MEPQLLANPKIALSPGMKPILKALTLMSSTTFFAILMSVGSTKIISLFGGTEGVAISGLFRNLAALVSGGITFGYSMVITQQMANARTPARISDVLSSVLLAFAFQCVLGLGIIIFFSTSIAQWTFAKIPSPYEITIIQIVLLMSFVNLALQTVTAVLKGQGKLRELTWLQLLTSGSSLLLILPLLRMGKVGLAINVASGGILATLVGLGLIQRLFEPRLTVATFKRGWKVLKEASLPSVLTTLESLFVLGGLLFVQSRVNQYYGLDGLGNYNAALLIIDTSIMILMASLRAHLLPSLAKLEGFENKAEVFRNTLTLLLVCGLLGGGILLFFSTWVVPLLFSDKFALAVPLLAIMSLSLVGQVFGWCYNTLFLQQGKFLSILVLDVCFIGSFTLLVLYGCLNHWPFLWIGWAYTGSCLLAGLLHLSVALRIWGFKFLGTRNLWLAIGGSIWLAFSYLVYLQRSTSMSLTFTLIFTAIIVILGKRTGLSDYFFKHSYLSQRPLPE